MKFNWFDVIVLFGILQGLVSAGVLLRKKTSTANRLLAAMLLVFSILSFKIVLHTLGLWDIPALRYFPLGIDLLIQPVLYLYVRALIRPWFKVQGAALLHFLPCCIFMLYAVVIYFAVLPVDGLAGKDAIAAQWHFNKIKSIEDILSVISSIAYGVMCFLLVRDYRRWLYQNISATNYATFTWLRNVLGFSGVLGALLLANITLDQLFHFNTGHFLHWEIFYVYLSVLIYYVAIKSYQQQEGPVALMYNEEKPPAQSSKYTPTELVAVKEAVTRSLEDQKLFLNSELTLNMLAANLKMSPALVSEAINKGLGKPFRQLVNDYRLAEVKQKLTDEKLAHLSILGIALECGFNSEASFYRIFKSATGQSPKTFIAKAKAGNALVSPHLS